MSDVPQFPQAPQAPVQLPTNGTPAQPLGMTFVDEKFHKPLYKMMKRLTTKTPKRLGKLGKLSAPLKKPKKVKVI